MPSFTSQAKRPRDNSLESMSVLLPRPSPPHELESEWATCSACPPPSATPQGSGHLPRAQGVVDLGAPPAPTLAHRRRQAPSLPGPVTPQKSLDRGWRPPAVSLRPDLPAQIRDLPRKAEAWRVRAMPQPHNHLPRRAVAPQNIGFAVAVEVRDDGGEAGGGIGYIRYEPGAKTASSLGTASLRKQAAELFPNKE